VRILPFEMHRLIMLKSPFINAYRVNSSTLYFKHPTVLIRTALILFYIIFNEVLTVVKQVQFRYFLESKPS